MASELLQLRQVCFDILSVALCGFDSLCVASCDLTACCAASCVSDAFWLMLRQIDGTQIPAQKLCCFKVQSGSPMKVIKLRTFCSCSDSSCQQKAATGGGISSTNCLKTFENIFSPAAATAVHTYDSDASVRFS
ncbi:hypothetical protein TNCV_3073971 [Trichonephila clavipes]|nr:hypothetical protein TNCV_3073971 [Trichonephila clavipes]